MPSSYRISLLIVATAIVALLVVLAIRISRQEKTLVAETSGTTALDTTAQQLIDRQQRNDSTRRANYYKKRASQRHYPSARGAATEATTAYNSQRSTTHYETKKLSFDLNEADTLDLQQLRGIGPTFARRIVRYRERLGGFYSIEQLKEVYGITPELVEQLSTQLTLDDIHLRQIDPNTATLDELKRHPYLDYYKAKAIVVYRQKGGRFQSADVLLKVSLLDKATLCKIKPYLFFAES